MTYLVDLRQLMNHVHRVVQVVHRMRNRKQPRIRRVLQCIVDVFWFHIRLKASVPWIHLSNRLLQAFLECSSDSHHFTNALHAGAHLAVDLLGELGKVPLRDLSDDVIQ